jgi:hypothetical protein
MKNRTLSFFILVVVLAGTVPDAVSAGQRRRVVVRPHRVVVRRPVVNTRLVVRHGYPIRRALPSTVVVRPARRVVTVNAPLVFLPRVAWTPTAVALPPADQLVWQDSESVSREEGWVDTNFGVESEGKALFLDINGRAGLNFAEITFANGNVQVVDFNERTHGTGIYRLLDFADGRRVMTVRLLAKSESEETKLAVYLSR